MRKKIEVADAPRAIGPYSQAVVTEQFVFVSGQVPIDPKEGKIVDFTIQGQTRQVIENIEAILRADGLCLDDIVKAEVYLKNMDDFKEMNLVYAEKFNGPIQPARQAMQVAKLPLDALVEISCIAIRKRLK